MTTSEIRVGAKLWYLSPDSSGMTRQDQVVVVATTAQRVKVKGESGRAFYVKAKNLRPTN